MKQGPKIDPVVLAAIIGAVGAIAAAGVSGLLH
jgi:hypothetical protein